MTIPTEKPTKTLLHACCGPCSLEPVRVLREQGVEPVVFYANSNIHPADEYARRLDTLRAWAAGAGLQVVEGSYDPDAWERTAGRAGDAARERFGVITHGPDADGSAAEGAGDAAAEEARRARCRACYRLRSEEAAAWAAAHGFDALGTTLSVSPYQYTDVIFEELERACARAGIAARLDDWRPYYEQATRRSREEGLYRQNYCGCRFSDEEAAAERAERKAARAAERAAARAERADRDAAEARERAERRAERAAYDARQARKRAVRKTLRDQARAEGPGTREAADEEGSL